MTIDIIAYSDAQLAMLDAEQIVEVQQAQVKKNNLFVKLEEEKRETKYRLLKNGVFRSPTYEMICQRLQKNYEDEVERIRQALLFYLRFSLEDMEGAIDAPYLVDYSLTFEDRLNVVRTYYDTTYSNADEKFAAFINDKVAVKYLGEYYLPLKNRYQVDSEWN